MGRPSWVALKRAVAYRRHQQLHAKLFSVTQLPNWLHWFLPINSVDSVSVYCSALSIFFTTMGCLSCLKWIVFVFNFIFWLAGVGVLSLAIWFLTRTAEVGGESHAFMTNLVSDMTGVYILLGTGGFMTVVGFLGCCGALRESQCLLASFFTVLLILFVGEIVAAVWLYQNPAEFRKLVEEKLLDGIRSKYDNDQVIRESFDLLQQKYKCCGVDGYQSWSKSEKNAKNVASGINYEVPKSCCSDPASNLCETTRNLGVVGLVGSSLSGVIYTEGCAPKVEKWLKDSDNTRYLIGVGIGVLVMELLGMIFSLVLCCAVRRVVQFKV